MNPFLLQKFEEPAPVGYVRCCKCGSDSVRLAEMKERGVTVQVSFRCTHCCNHAMTQRRVA